MSQKIGIRRDCIEKLATRLGGGLQIIKFGKYSDNRGDLIFIDGCLPFEPKRIFYIVNILVDKNHGTHAH